MCGGASAGMPAPVSCTSSAARLFVARTITSTRPPAGVYLMALSTRLTITCLSRARSPSTLTRSSDSQRSVMSLSSASNRICSVELAAIPAGSNEYSGALLIADRITDAARRPNQLPLAPLVNFVPQVAHVNVHDVRRPVEALIPDMLDDHGARDHAPGVGHQVF